MPLILNGTTGVSGIDGSAGTPSYVGGDSDTGLWYPAANTLALSTSGSERLRIDSSGNVGIGTNSPSVALSIERSATSAYVQTIRTGSANLYIGSQTTENVIISRDSTTGNFPLAFSTGTTERMRIDTSGNVLVGTTATVGTSKFVVAGVNGSTSPKFQGASNSGAYLDFYNNAQSTDGFRIGQGFSSGSDNIALISNNDNAAMVFRTNATERMRIDSSGNVLVGATSTVSSARFLVAGVSSVTSPAVQGSASAGAYQYFYNNAQSSSSFQIGQGFASGTDNIALLYNNANAAMVFGTNGTERMRITSGGDLCIGTTSTTVTGARLTLRGTQSWAVGPQASDSTFYVYNESSQGVYILNGGTSWTSSSDERKKDIIEPITDATNKVSQLRAVIGKFKNDEEGVRRSFLIAQDVQKVLPEAVNELNDEDKTLGVQYTDVIPLLVAAIKEQQAMIEELKAKVAALEK